MYLVDLYGNCITVNRGDVQNYMNCPVDYDHDAERRAMHPDLLPEEGWSADPKDRLEIPRFSFI